jgi:hypothetical protein
VDLFKIFFDDEILDKIVYWTNERAVHNKQSEWTKLDKRELLNFLGLYVLMGQVKLPTQRHYWSTDNLYCQKYFRRVMVRNRFEAILKNLCFYNFKETDLNGRLFRVKGILEKIVQNIQSTVVPEENLSIDEELIKFKGRLIFRQYIANKSAKYGIKIFSLCSADGFVHNMEIYGGKGTVDPDDDGFAASIVKKLMTKYLDQGYTLYMDNYYNSVQLAKFLYNHKTYCAGTLRKNLKLNPKHILNEKLKLGESIVAENGPIKIVKWKDKREVLMITTKHSCEFEEGANRRGVLKTKPDVIFEYNKYMAGVDRLDQMLSYYTNERRTKKWYLKVFFHLLEVSLWNAFLMKKKYLKLGGTFLEFRDDFVKNATFKMTLTESNSHYPEMVEKYVRCRQCTKNGKRGSTKMVCDSCRDDQNNLIGLCPGCFKQYHIDKRNSF